MNNIDNWLDNLLKELGIEDFVLQDGKHTTHGYLKQAILAHIKEIETGARMSELQWALSRLNTFGKETGSDALNRAINEIDDNTRLLAQELKTTQNTIGQEGNNV